MMQTKRICLYFVRKWRSWLI